MRNKKAANDPKTTTLMNNIEKNKASDFCVKRTFPGFNRTLSSNKSKTSMNREIYFNKPRPSVPSGKAASNTPDNKRTSLKSDFVPSAFLRM